MQEKEKLREEREAFKKGNPDHLGVAWGRGMVCGNWDGWKVWGSPQCPTTHQTNNNNNK